MEVILNGIYNFLNFVEENWTMICAIVVMAMAIGKKTVAFFSKSQEEQLEIAMVQIRVIMLKLVTKAEISYLDYKQSGQIKRSEVIDQIFAMYPILSKVTSQEDIIAFIDDAIDEALKTMRKIFEENKSVDEVETIVEPEVTV